MKSNIKSLVRHSELSEKAIEKYLLKSVSFIGGICLKYSSNIETGYPDRLVMVPGGLCAWVELKSKGKKLTKLQDLRHNQLRELGFPVYVFDSKEGVDKLINELLR